MKHARWIFAFALLLSSALPAAATPRQVSSSLSATQAPAPAPAPGPEPAAQPQKKKSRHAEDFLIRGTVFDDKALALPGARLRIRRSSEKKSRWETWSNSRGEFAVRVPRGTDYELAVGAKGFAGQKKAVQAKGAEREENLLFRMERSASRKTGEKK